MSVKCLCDCCGKEIDKDDFMVLSLLPYRSIRGLPFDKSLVSLTSNQELCDSCAAEFCEHYKMMQAKAHGVKFKRVCLNCGVDNDDDIVCPICKSSNWGLEEV